VRAVAERQRAHRRHGQRRVFTAWMPLQMIEAGGPMVDIFQPPSSTALEHGRQIKGRNAGLDGRTRQLRVTELRLNRGG